MYGGEDDENELASLSAPAVMSPSKTSLIFNGSQLPGTREKREHKTHIRTHTTATYADNAEHYRPVHTYTKCSKPACTVRDHTHTCTLVLTREQGSLRVNGVETQGP